MTLRVYVAAPYQDAPMVRGLHGRLRDAGVLPVSSWVSSAHGAEDLDAMDPMAARAVALYNDRDLRSADLVLVVARDGAGGEMFAEARFALELRKPVLWVGRLVLSAFREGVTRCATLDAALSRVSQLARFNQ